MRIEIPEFALVAMIGATSSGKTTFAHKHFLPTEVLSSDFFRAMVNCHRCHKFTAVCKKTDN